MKKIWCGTISVMLIVVMLINLLPVNVLAIANSSEIEVSEMPTIQEQTPDTDLLENEQITEDRQAYIVEEDISKRSEFCKEFILSNGLRLATIYPDSVHYEENGQWKEIDNTLTAKIVDGQSVYTNTSGLWDVRFPQRLNTSNSIAITKDGYTVSFGMAGEMRSSGGFVVASMDNELETNTSTILPTTGGTIDSIAQVQQIDATTAKEKAEYAEIIPDKLHSRLLYPSVYNNTNICYDLQSNQIKESIIIQAFDSGLIGYRYTLNTGGLIPVLNDDQSISLCDPDSEDIVMTMPAPFMLDANDEYCEDITVSLVQSDNGYILSYHLPVEWLSAEDRAWPIILDPVISANNATNNIQDITVAENGTESNTAARVKCGYHPTLGICRFYLRFKALPSLTSSMVIVKANITLTKNTSSSLSAPIEVHKVDAPWEASQTNWSNKPNYQNNIEDVTTVEDAGEYIWDITDIAFGWYADTENTLANNTGMLFKAANAVETAQVNNWQQLCSSDHTLTRPVLTITYIDTNGLESYWDTTSNSAGRAGTGYIQPYSGNLTWIHTDIGFDGNLMPVSISHIYNASDAGSGTDLFGMGIGWRTNYNQRIIDPGDGTLIWEDGDGTPHTFVASSNQWKDTDNLGLTLTLALDPTNSGNTIYTITDKYGCKSVFASNGHLTAQINNQATESMITIEYTNTPAHRISLIKDGVGRQYKFVYYANGLLKQIDYYGSNEISEHAQTNAENIFAAIYYGYTGSALTSITYADGLQSHFNYTSGNLLSSVTDSDGYTIAYSYNTLDTGKLRRVVSVSESDNGHVGGTATLEYTFNRTILTDYKGNAQTYFFNPYGNTISIQDSEGRATFRQYDTDIDDEEGIKNRIKESSQQQNTVVNLIRDHSFESGITWICGPYATCTNTPTKAYLGNRSLQVNCQYGGYTGVTSENYNIAAGSTVTFSAYIFVSSGTISLRIDNGVTYYESDYLSSGNDWTRLEVTYKNSSTSTKQISLSLFFVDKGTAYMDCVQLEKANTASRYNLIEDSDFQHSYAWTALDGSASGANHGYNVPAPTLDHRMIDISNYPNQTMYVQQSVNVKGQAGDTFVFGGWMGGNASANPAAVWALRLVINNTDGTTTEASISPNRNLPGMNVWQYVASSVTAEKAYKSVYFRIDYGYDSNSVHADGLQLFREPFGEEYTYDDEDDDNTNDNGNVILVRDILGQETKYTYTNNDPTYIEHSSGTTIEQEFINHNLTRSVERFMLNGVSTATASHIYSYDEYGNLIKHQAQSGSTIKITKASYSDDHNHLASTTDEMDNVTYYCYDPDESTLLWVQYPEDTTGEQGEDGTETIDTRTYYKYDSMYRLKNTSSAVNQDTSMSAKYTYSGDALTQIQTPSTVYKLDYHDLGLRKSVSVGETPLATYIYTHSTDIDVIDQDKLLKHLDYGNNDDVKYYYDDLGRITKEIYYDNGSSTASRTVTYTYDNNGALATTVDSKTGTTTKFYYDTVGRLDRQVRYVGSSPYTLQYTYDDRGNVVSVKDMQNGSIYTTTYQYDGLNRVTDVASGTSSENYVYDAYGRYDGGYVKHNGNWVLYKSVFYGGKSERETSDRVYVWSCTSRDGYKDHYTFIYDGNGNIVSVEKNNYTTQYVYDSQNQLIRENNEEAGKTWVWTYDAAGNITSKKEYAYTTGALGTVQDSITYSYPTSGAWKDLLTSYDGKTISYDVIGNPLSDGTWTYTWEQGRQLLRMSYAQNVWNFTYDSNGMRTRRSNAGTGDTYTYVYNGNQLSRMTYGSNTMWFAYGADGSPLTITYNGTTYYYVTNLQGDVVAILNSAGTAVVNYTYDAWGKPLTTTGSMANTLGMVNPLRYRGYVYDRETGLYYLQSRYYNPTWGRFINADGIISAFQSLSGNNLFTYCYNNPICFSDDSGAFPMLVVGIITAIAVIIGTDHALAANQPEGGYAVGSVVSQNAYQRGLYAEGGGFVLDANGISLCDLNIGLFESKIIGEYFSLDVLNIFTASAIAELDWSGTPELDVSAVASIYSPGFEATLPLWIFDITISGEAHLGAVGAGIELDPDSGKFKFTPPMLGVGGSFGIDFDLNFWPF